MAVKGGKRHLLTLKNILSIWNCSKDYFDMIYVMFRAIEDWETSFSIEKLLFWMVIGGRMMN